VVLLHGAILCATVQHQLPLQMADGRQVSRHNQHTIAQVYHFFHVVVDTFDVHQLKCLEAPSLLQLAHIPVQRVGNKLQSSLLDGNFDFLWLGIGLVFLPHDCHSPGLIRK
jgi:hypothetical protein